VLLCKRLLVCNLADMEMLLNSELWCDSPPEMMHDAGKELPTSSE
jgi:hypothetical protein